MSELVRLNPAAERVVESFHQGLPLKEITEGRADLLKGEAMILQWLSTLNPEELEKLAKRSRAENLPSWNEAKKLAAAEMASIITPNPQIVLPLPQLPSYYRLLRTLELAGCLDRPKKGPVLGIGTSTSVGEFLALALRLELPDNYDFLTKGNRELESLMGKLTTQPDFYLLLYLN